MPLTYGFNSHGWDKDAAKWTKKYEALSDVDKEYYHNVLSFGLMIADVSHVSKATIPVIVHRLEATARGEFFKVGPDDKIVTPGEAEEYLQRFIGFEANVNTLTDAEWVKRFLPKAWSKNASIKGEKAITAERLNFEKEVFGTDRRARIAEITGGD